MIMGKISWIVVENRFTDFDQTFFHYQVDLWEIFEIFKNIVQY